MFRRAKILRKLGRDPAVAQELAQRARQRYPARCSDYRGQHDSVLRLCEYHGVVRGELVGGTRSRLEGVALTSDGSLSTDLWSPRLIRLKVESDTDDLGKEYSLWMDRKRLVGSVYRDGDPSAISFDLLERRPTTDPPGLAEYDQWATGQ